MITSSTFVTSAELTVSLSSPNHHASEQDVSILTVALQNLKIIDTQAKEKQADNPAQTTLTTGMQNPKITDAQSKENLSANSAKSADQKIVKSQTEATHKQSEIDTSLTYEEAKKSFEDIISKFSQIIESSEEAASKSKAMADDLNRLVSRFFYATIIDHLCPPHMLPELASYHIKDFRNGMIVKYVSFSEKNNWKGFGASTASLIHQIGLSILERTIGLRAVIPPDFLKYPVLKKEEMQKWVVQKHPKAPAGKEARNDLVSLIFRTRINTATGKADNLTKLTLEGSGIDAAHLRGILKLSPNLTELTLKEISALAVGGYSQESTSISEEFLLNPEPLMKRREEYSTMWAEVNAASLAKMLKGHTAIKTLRLINCDWVAYETLACLSEHHPDLEHLDCTGCNFMSWRFREKAMFEQAMSEQAQKMGGSLFPEISTVDFYEGLIVRIKKAFPKLKTLVMPK